MFKTLALALALAASLFGTTGVETRGPFTVVTFVSPAVVPGLPMAGETTTVLYIQCSDPTIAGVRVKITYQNDSGEHELSLLADFVNGNGGVVTTVPADQITKKQFTERRDGATY